MAHSLGVRFGLAIFFLLWVPLMAAAGSGAYWLWMRTGGAGASSGVISLALHSDTRKLEDATTRLSEKIDVFLLERIAEVRSWAASPVVVGSVKKVRAAHAKEGFDSLSLQQIESKFRTRKSLGLAPEARAFLGTQLRRSSDFGGVFFTDAQGFNVALSGPATDFVQSDEEWWQETWSSGIFVGDIVFSSSANMWTMDIAVAIRDVGTGDNIGVMKAVVPLRFAQLFSDRVARRLSVPGQLLHAQLGGSALNGAEALSRTEVLVATRDGLLIAETRSAHAPERIMQPEVNVLTDESLAHLARSYDSEPAGSFIAAGRKASNSPEGASSRLIAFARSADASFFAPAVGNFSGVGWMVIAEAPNMSGHSALPEFSVAPAGNLRNIGQQLLWLGVTLFAALLLSSILLCWVFGRWVLTPVRALTDRVQGIEQGQVNARITLSSTGEFEDLAGALDRVRTMIVRMAQRLRETSRPD